ncbi:FkbM family methyltransferase [Hymenobacter sp. B81]|uniref:FkbM family methyltransferase n=1 Tax=Hymenobacter sp. B81 TaxID=3344878 RepID=UPI0037DC1F48
MNIAKVVKNRHLLYLICKLGYRRNHRNLQDLKIFHQGRFYLYNVEGFGIASEGFNWYLTREHLEQALYAVGCKYYVPRPGDTVVDIGAGLGEESSIIARLVGPQGRVFAIEANPVVYDVLRQVLADNQLGNVSVYNLALSPVREKVVIEDNPANYLGSTLDQASTENLHEVEGWPLQDFCRQQGLRRIDFLKVNIEGAERFLSDFFATTDVVVPHVAIACHDFRFRKEHNEFFRTKELVADYLAANGYQLQFQHTGIDYIDDWVYGTKL